MRKPLISALSAPLLCLGLLLDCSLARAQDAFTIAIADLQQRWAVANYELRGKPRLTALQTLSQETERLTAAHPRRAEVWIWSGIVRATIANTEGGVHALGAAEAARADLERAVELNPRAMNGAAYANLGALYYKAPGWPVGFGDKGKAEQMLQRALEINPNSVDGNYFYGDFLLEQGHRRKAREYLLRAQQAPTRPHRPLADSGRQREIAKLLERATSS